MQSFNMQAWSFHEAHARLRDPEFSLDTGSSNQLVGPAAHVPEAVSADRHAAKEDKARAGG